MSTVVSLSPIPSHWKVPCLIREADVAVYRWMYKHLREIARRMPFYRGEILDWHPAFPAGSDAACKPENEPVGIDAAKLVYTTEDDAAIDDYHRRMSAYALFPHQRTIY